MARPTIIQDNYDASIHNEIVSRQMELRNMSSNTNLFWLAEVMMNSEFIDGIDLGNISYAKWIALYACGVQCSS
ncbi:MAG: hypothetical protein ACLTTH_15720 [Holdemanella porci]